MLGRGSRDLDTETWSKRSMHIIGCRRATHWLFSRLVGATGVTIPDTALFDDEGVLTAWLSTPEAPESQPKGKRQCAPIASTPAIRSRPELSLLQFEAHLQDLARKSPRAVAVTFDEEPPLVLDECALDAKIRALCVRERTMNAPEPDIGLTRQYPGGQFLIQASGNSTFPVSSFPQSPARTVLTRFRVTQDGESFSHHLQRPIVESASDEHFDGPGIDSKFPVDFSCVEMQCRALVAHLVAVHGCVVHVVVLEFLLVSRGLATSPVLTCVHDVKWKVEGQISQDMEARSNATQTRPKKRCSHAYRICRQCRAPVEVDLARELVQQQTLLRGVLAKYQESSERHAEAEARFQEATDRVAHREAQIVGLEAEITRLREQLSEASTLLRQVRHQNEEISIALADAKEQTVSARRAVTAAHEEVQHLQLRQAETAVLAYYHGESLERDWMAHNAMLSRQLRDLRFEVENAMVSNRALTAELEDARAAYDEMSLQWNYVVRKLTDVGDKGVLPPKRVAGGFISYPIPSAQNVEHVVKWIVDFEARRAIFDAQQRSGHAQRPQSAKRRLRIKIELMRLLANPTGQPTSPSRRRSARPKLSKSPRKPTQGSPRRHEGRVPVQPTLVSERLSVASSVGDTSQ